MRKTLNNAYVDYIKIHFQLYSKYIRYSAHVARNSRAFEFNEIELEKWKLNQVHVMMLHSCGKHDRNPFLMQIRPLQRWSLNSLWYICNIKKNISKKMAKSRFFGIYRNHAIYLKWTIPHDIFILGWFLKILTKHWI